MAITTKWTSGNFHLTAQGATYTKIFNCTWAEFQSGAGLPKIGGKLTGIIGGFNGWEDMRCTDIQAQPFAGGTDTKIEVYCTFSTIAKVVRQAKADTSLSWEIEFDFSSSQEPIRYWEDGDGVTHIWQKEWMKYIAENLQEFGYLHQLDPDDPPELQKYSPAFVFRLKAFSKKLFFKDVISSVGTINAMQLLDPLLALTDSETVLYGQPMGDDTEMWLLDSCPMRRIRPNCWEYNFNFIHAGIKKYTDSIFKTWNVVNEIETKDLYNTYDFMDLLREMNTDNNAD